MPNRVLRSGLLAGLIAGALAFLIHIMLVVPVALRSLATDDGVEISDGGADWLGMLMGDIGAAMGYGILLAAIFAMVGKPVSRAVGALSGLAGFFIVWLLPGLIWAPELNGVAMDTATPEVAADFVTASACMHLVRWLALGTAVAWLFERFGPPPARGTTVDISA